MENGQEDMPLIDALDNADQTSLSNSTSVKRKIPSEALKKIRDQQNLIKQLQRQRCVEQFVELSFVVFTVVECVTCMF